MFVSIHQKGISRHFRVTLNGQDVSENCYAANDRMGIALCYKRNQEGKKYIEDREAEKQRPAREIVRGKVRIIYIRSNNNG